MAATRNRMPVAEDELPERLPAQLVQDFHAAFGQHHARAVHAKGQRAAAGDRPQRQGPDPGSALEKFLASHPTAKTFLTTQNQLPQSWALTSYYPVNAVQFTDARGPEPLRPVPVHTRGRRSQPGPRR